MYCDIHVPGPFKLGSPPGAHTLLSAAPLLPEGMVLVDFKAVWVIFRDVLNVSGGRESGVDIRLWLHGLAWAAEYPVWATQGRQASV